MVQTRSGAGMPSTPPRGDEQDQIPEQIIVGNQEQPLGDPSPGIPEPSQTPAYPEVATRHIIATSLPQCRTAGPNTGLCISTYVLGIGQCPKRLDCFGSSTRFRKRKIVGK